MTAGSPTGAGERDRIDRACSPALVVEVRWDPGAAETALAAFVCSADGTVLSQGHFVFRIQPVAGDRSVFLREDHPSGSGKTAQVLVDGTVLPATASSIELALATIPLSGHTLGSTSAIEVAVWRPADGVALASCSVPPPGPSSCVRLARLHVYDEEWGLEKVAQTYPKDFASLVRDFGVQLRD
ncbi:hypothetical protein DJ010_00875 [Nocardioides silvaticus]|uniref:TerD domain-containing protein n=1 Tax=Nocardioides silvaticus TaxID=2201891 RepID=A0A316TLV7_9ACTN|nr:TerD family protein [Nocardioides silvaticus]PWN04239.1 hypothetical protein DJ010_00875 [Nocardioides silvaticus]